MKIVVAAQPQAASITKREPPNGGVVEEAKQAIKDATPIPSSASLAIQDPKAFQPPIP